jgi:hypothetical protein
MDSKKIEEKAKDLLATEERFLLQKIIHEARMMVEYREYREEKDPEACFKFIETIADPSKWDYHGLRHKEGQKIVDVLEYLLDDNMKEIKHTKEWKKPEY